MKPLRTITVYQIDLPIFSRRSPLVVKQGERDRVLPQHQPSIRLNDATMCEAARVFGIRGR